MGELSELFVVLICVFLMLTGFYIILGDLSNNYNPTTSPQDIRMQNTTQGMYNLAAEISNTTQSDEITSGEFFGIPAALSINVYTSMKLIFKLPQVLGSLVDNSLALMGDLGLGWVQGFLLALISIVLTFLFVSMILRYNT